jgi:hypothetical protein
MGTAILEALIPLCGGLYAALLGYGIVKPRTVDPKTVRYVAQLKWLGPLVMAFGVWILWQGLRNPTPAEIVQGMRQKVALPLVVDEMTRLDQIDAGDHRIVYRMTLTKAPQSSAELDALMQTVRQKIKLQVCADESRRRLLRSNIDLEFVYSIGEKQLPSIAVTRADCGD